MSETGWSYKAVFDTISYRWDMEMDSLFITIRGVAGCARFGEGSLDLENKPCPCNCILWI